MPDTPARHGLDISPGSDLVADAVDAWHDAPRNENGFIPLDDHMASILAAVSPTIAAQVRRETAEQIATALGAKATRALHEAKEFSTVTDLAKSLVTRAGALSAAAEIARKIGEADE